jgi:hypothetical protein
MNAARAWKQASLHQSVVDRQLIMRLLGVSHPFAATPFVMMDTEDGPRLAAAIDPPPVLSVSALPEWDVDPDTDVITICVQSGRTKLLGDPNVACFLGDHPPCYELPVFTDGRRFARAWALARQAFIDQHRQACVPGLLASDPPDACRPGAVLVGDIDSVFGCGPLFDAEHLLVDDPSFVRAINNLMIIAFGVPTVKAARPHIHKVA